MYCDYHCLYFDPMVHEFMGVPNPPVIYKRTLLHGSPNRRFRYLQTCTVRQGIWFIKNNGWGSHVLVREFDFIKNRRLGAPMII